MSSKKTEIGSSQAMRYSEESIDFSKITVLPQMRTDFDQKSLQELADSIAVARSLINPPIIAIFPQKAFWRYSEFVCAVYQRELGSKEKQQIKKKIGKSKVQVMIAGERRLRSLKILWDQGCSDCQKEAGGKVANGKCWQKHMGTLSKVITVRVPSTEDPAELLGIQLSENVHSRPNTYEEADSIAKYAIFLKLTNNKLSYEKMAERMGRSPEMISKALSFYALPVSIKNMVRYKQMKYGFANELARLKEIGYNEEGMLREVNIALVDKKLSKVSAFAEHVSGIITAYIQKQNNEITTLGLVIEGLSAEKRVASILNPDAIHLARILVSNFTKILKVWESADNKAFTKDRYFTTGGFVEDYAKVVPLIESLLPYVEKEVTVEEAKKMRATVVNIRRVLHRKQKQLSKAN